MCSRAHILEEYSRWQHGFRPAGMQLKSCSSSFAHRYLYLLMGEGLSQHSKGHCRFFLRYSSSSELDEASEQPQISLLASWLTLQVNWPFKPDQPHLRPPHTPVTSSSSAPMAAVPSGSDPGLEAWMVTFLTGDGVNMKADLTC